MIACVPAVVSIQPFAPTGIPMHSQLVNQNRDVAQPTSVEDLVKTVRVRVDDMVEEVDPDPGGAPDTGLPQPDRDWFNSGG
jgi:hypothetical protein